MQLSIFYPRGEGGGKGTAGGIRRPKRKKSETPGIKARHQRGVCLEVLN